MPTDEQLREYAGKLAPIYEAVLFAFPSRSPDRRVGDSLIEEAIEDYVQKQGKGLRWSDVGVAISKLIERGFLEQSQTGAVYPTLLGERLITALTGHVPTPAGVPDLPVPTWG